MTSAWNLGECLDCGEIWADDEAFMSATLHGRVYGHQFVMYRTGATSGTSD